MARRAYAAFNRGDLEGMLADFAPDSGMSPPGRSLGSKRSIAGLRDFGGS